MKTAANWFVLAYLAIWCWVDGFMPTAFGLTVLVLTEVLWKPFANSSLAVKLFGTETMADISGQQKSATGRRQ